MELNLPEAAAPTTEDGGQLECPTALHGEDENEGGPQSSAAVSGSTGVGSKSNAVYRLIRKTELQHRTGGRGDMGLGRAASASAADEAERSSHPGEGEQLRFPGADSGSAPLISWSDMATDRSHLNPVYRLIRKKELQLRKGRQHEGGHAQPGQEGGDRQEAPFRTFAASVNEETGNSLIADASMASEKSRLNPVYRLIRKAELQHRLSQRSHPSRRQQAQLSALRGPGPSLGDFTEEAPGSELWELPLNATSDGSRQFNDGSRRYQRIQPLEGADDDAPLSGSGQGNVTSAGPRIARGSSSSRSAQSQSWFSESESTDQGPSAASAFAGSSMVLDEEMASDQARMNPVFRYVMTFEYCRSEYRYVISSYVPFMCMNLAGTYLTGSLLHA